MPEREEVLVPSDEERLQMLGVFVDRRFEICSSCEDGGPSYSACVCNPN